MTSPATGIVISRCTRSLYQNRRGQTTILFALTIMIFICFIAFMVNVGQLVHSRILTQAVADMVALSAANVQAVGMNEIADLNHEHRSMQNELLKWLRTTFFFSSRGEVNRLCDYFEDLIDVVSNYKRNVNNMFPTYARNAAYQTLAWYNTEYGGFAIKELILSGNLGRLVNLTNTGSRTLRGIYVQGCPRCPQLTTYRANKNRYFPVQFTGTKNGVPVIQARYLDKTYERKTVGTRVYTIVHVTREEMGSLVNIATLGFDVKIPRMEAISAAMPTGGSIEEGLPTYFARFVPLEAFGYGGYYH